MVGEGILPDGGQPRGLEQPILPITHQVRRYRQRPQPDWVIFTVERSPDDLSKPGGEVAGGRINDVGQTHEEWPTLIPGRSKQGPAMRVDSLPGSLDRPRQRMRRPRRPMGD